MDVHLCASNFGCQPKSRLRGLISPVIINRRIPWPSLKRRHSRWSVRETRRRGQRFLIFGGDEIILFALTWRETESVSWDCFLICSEKCISRPLWLHLSRPEWLCRQFSIIRRVIICCIIGQHGFSWAQFCLGKWAQERWHSGSRKEQRVVEKGGERGEYTWRTPRLVTTWHDTPLASTVNCRKCSVKPGLNQNAMIWLVPIFHSWKSPETGDLCHASKNAGL